MPNEASELPLAPKGLVSWVLVFAINLPVPMLFGASIVGGVGWAGVLLGMVSILAVTIFMHRISVSLMRIIWTGGIATAASQLFPVPHVLAGSIAIELVRVLGLLDRDPLMGVKLESTATAFVITLVTGGILLLVALGVGAIYTAFVKARQTKA